MKLVPEVHAHIYVYVCVYTPTTVLLSASYINT